jgi:hypothetical protein
MSDDVMTVYLIDNMAGKKHKKTSVVLQNAGFLFGGRSLLWDQDLIDDMVHSIQEMAIGADDGRISGITCSLDTL